MNGLFGSMNIGDRQYGGSSMGLTNDLIISEKLHEKDILFLQLYVYELGLASLLLESHFKLTFL